MKKNYIKTLALYAILIVGIIVAVSFVFGSNEEEPLTYSDVVDYFRNDEVVSFTVDENMFITMTVAKFDENGNKISGSESTIGYQLAGYPLLESLERYYLGGEDGIPNANLVEYDIIPDTESPWWVSYLPFIIIIILVIVFWFFVMNQMNGGKSGGGAGGKFANFGKARVKTPQADGKKVLFSDVAGADEEKAELEEVVEYLKDPSKFSKLGAKIPHGVLLMGPPGTGKTLLAKAVAGEAGVPFFSISGSDFVEMYVGVGASRVRDLFETARKAPASIVFIDEIDAVGRHRGAGLGGGHDEREQTLNQLLVEMDGFGSHEGIIVIAATNRPDILDPALLRPGRFDRQITVNYPDIKGREEILHVHARNKPFEKTVNFADVAKTTSGFTGADLANLLNEAALLAARRKKSLIGMEDIEDAFIKVIAGPKKKTKTHKESELRKTAYHEAGHAILAHLLPTQDPVQQISIIPSGNALGYTLNPPTEDRYSVYKNELKEKISMLLGGRAAEEIIFGDVSGGASNDIQRATDIAKKMVTQLGMSDILGPRCFGTGHNEVFLGKDFSSAKDFSEEIAAKIDFEIQNIITESYNKAKEILRANIEKLHFVSEFLLKHEIMDGEQFAAAMDKEDVTFEDLEEMNEAKKRRSREENDEKLRAEKAEERRQKEEAERIQKAAEENLPDEADKDDAESDETTDSNEENSDEN